MKRKLLAGVLSAVFALVVAGSAEALIILGPSDADWTTEQNSNLSEADIEALCGCDVDEILLNSDGGGALDSSYDITFSDGNEDALIEYVSGTAISCPTCILVAKDGEAPPPGDEFTAQYLFDLGSWDGMESISLEGLWPGSGSFSHLSIWGGPADVTDVTDVADITDVTDVADITPEPATLALFGSGLAIAAARLRRRKTASRS